MDIAEKTVLITGANRGIGQALVDEALRRGASKVYAAMRVGPRNADKRITTLALDVTDALQVQRAADQVEALDLLVNNAGIAVSDDLSDQTAIERHLAVNLWGPYYVTRAFLPLLLRSRGAIINNLSLLSFAPS